MTRTRFSTRPARHPESDMARPSDSNTRRQRPPWRIITWFSAIIGLASCGGGALSLPDSVAQMNAIAAEGRARAGALYVEYQQIPEPTVADASALLGRELVIRSDLQTALTTIQAPDEIAHLHTRMVDWHAAVIEAERKLGARAAQASNWNELTGSDESRAYDELIAEGLSACGELQAELDSMAESRGAFADNPWIPTDLKNVVNAVLGCDAPATG